MTDLDPSTHKLSQVLGRYVFKDKIKCGLSNCHTWHAKGYIVKTESGQETNIGKDCGKTYFGVDFETLSRKFDRDITEQENRQLLWSFTFQLEELELKINELRTSASGADWVYKKTRPLVERGRGCPDDVVRHILELLKSRSNLLSESREATPQEIENLEGAQGKRLNRPHYLEIQIAEIRGLAALYPEYDLRLMLVVDLEQHLKSFRTKDIDTMTFEELRHWVKWIGTVDKTIENAVGSISRGRELLRFDNLIAFEKILAKQDDKNAFRTYLKSL